MFTTVLNKGTNASSAERVLLRNDYNNLFVSFLLLQLGSPRPSQTKVYSDDEEVNNLFYFFLYVIFLLSLPKFVSVKRSFNLS